MMTCMLRLQKNKGEKYWRKWDCYSQETDKGFSSLPLFLLWASMLKSLRNNLYLSLRFVDANEDFIWSVDVLKNKTFLKRNWVFACGVGFAEVCVIQNKNIPHLVSTTVQVQGCGFQRNVWFKPSVLVLVTELNPRKGQSEAERVSHS